MELCPSLTLFSIVELGTTLTDELAQAVARADKQLEKLYASAMVVDNNLSRRTVSFQSSKALAGTRWFKYKEAFSAELVEYLLSKWNIHNGRLLDPFAGSGTALFAGANVGLQSVGIELLPPGVEVIHSRLMLESPKAERLVALLHEWMCTTPWKSSSKRLSLAKLRITDGAYPPNTLDGIENYLSAASEVDASERRILQFALMCVLEEVSFTRKDGQYLRWDYRSGRTLGKKQFDKGVIPSFDDAMVSKLRQILLDVSSLSDSSKSWRSNLLPASVSVQAGSCLTLMPQLPAGSFDTIVTSPPYCNRYDYTRTYALELALLGCTEDSLKGLRQEMLSCTVENRAKNLTSLIPAWLSAVEAANGQELLQTILSYLEGARDSGLLNNTGIARMVRGYFYEMACVIFESSRVLKPGGLLFMVNDNVRYAGVGVSVDLILTDIATKLGFYLENILVLPKGKGNSSQQMGAHGREALRKCVYVWRKEQ